jgi:hypothetical protein
VATRKRKGDKQLAEGLELEGYVVAGTPAAFEALDPRAAESPRCVRCGSPISHVFLTSKGPMGGDCLATLTGDPATRRLARTIAKKLDLFEAWDKRIIALEVKRGQRDFVVWAVETDYNDFDEWTGLYGEKTEYVACGEDRALTEAIVAFEAETRGMEYRGPQ